RLLEDVAGHHHVVVHERTRIAAVETDPPHVGCEVDDELGAVHGFARRSGIPQVVLSRPHDMHLGAKCIELANYRGAYEPGPTGDGDRATGPITSTGLPHRPVA